jgi:6-phosphogluconolactonase (cycloisomerase 2 family)
MVGRATCSQAAVLGLLAVLSVGCGGGSSATTRAPACAPASPAFAYALSYAVDNPSASTVSMYTVNSCSGSLTATAPATVATGANAFGAEGLAVDPGGRFAYVANLMSNASDTATIAMYTIDSGTGVLTPTTPATVPTGYFPQGIAIDPFGRFVYTANSDDNTVSMFTINSSTGVLTPTTPAAVPAGWSPGFVTVHPSGKFAYASNQDDDTISMYTINSTTGILTPMIPAAVSAGPSPFGITLDPSGKFAFVPDAYSQPNNFVQQYTVDSITGVLIPNGSATSGNGSTSVAVDPSSKFAYVVNRDDNTVSMFTINPTTGRLTPNTPPTIATGQEPFGIVVDPSGNFAYVSNQNSSSISIYTLNGDGTLTAAGTAATGTDPIALAVTRTTQ